VPVNLKGLCPPSLALGGGGGADGITGRPGPELQRTASDTPSELGPGSAMAIGSGSRFIKNSRRERWLGWCTGWGQLWPAKRLEEHPMAQRSM